MKPAFFIIILLLFLVRNKYLAIPKENSNGIKGILALLIILTHCSTSYNGGQNDLTFFSNIGSIVCSMFFFISAYGLHSQEDKIRNATFLNFVESRIWKVLSPFIFITLGYQILIITTGDFNLIELLNTLKKGDTILLLPNSWFVFTLTYLYILTFLSTRFKRNHMEVIFIFVMITVYILITKNVLHWGNHWYSAIYGYFGGVVCKKNYISIYKLNIWRICAVIALILIYIYWPYRDLLIIITPSYLSLILIYGICSLPINKICHKLSFLNKISYEIYLFQGYALTIFFKNFEGNIFIYLFGIYGVTLILASAYYYIKNYIYKYS